MEIGNVLKKLHLKNNGQYDNSFYVIQLENSDDYAKMYTKLSEYAINTENPNFQVNTNNTTVKVTNYFEIDENNITYNIFLIADFDNDKYYIKIGEQ